MKRAARVATWVLSSIKFQADMGILLTFMFLWNMVGALILMPALAHFLLKPRPLGEGEGERPGLDENQRETSIEATT